MVYKEIKFNINNILEGINCLAEAVLFTMGPEGKTVIISDEFEGVRITKDGVSVAKSINFEDPVMDLGATIIKQVAEKTVEDAGDGTTTSICLAQAIINQGRELLKTNSNSEVQKLLEAFEEKVLIELQKVRKDITPKDILSIAKISANGDNNIATIIDSAFSNTSNVKVVEGNNIEDLLKIEEGMELDTTYFDKAFINDTKKQAAIYEDVLVLAVPGKVEDLTIFGNILNNLNQKPLLFIAEGFSDNAIQLLKLNYNKGVMNVIPVKAPGVGSFRKDIISDIATYTRSSKDTGSGGTYYVGSARNVFAGSKRTVITVDESSLEVKEKINLLKEAKGNYNKSDYEFSLLEKRIDLLTGKVAIIQVGGKSDIEIKERKDRVEDAVKAVESALQEGIVEGGGVALYKIYNNNINIPFIKALQAPYLTITDNGAVFSVEDNMFDKDIIDPYKVTRCALENAISVSKTILSTSAIVLNKSEWK